MSIEAMKLAREVIQDYVDEHGPHEKDSGAAYTLAKLDKAIEQAQKQEPVGTVRMMSEGRDFTIEPKREWVGLTQDDLNMILDRMKNWNSYSMTDVYVAIEAKLREKNG
jgi:hypothetical protein